MDALLCLATLGAGAVWLRALSRWDGSRPCAPEDCETCPFPRCPDRPARTTGEEARRQAEAVK